MERQDDFEMREADFREAEERRREYRRYVKHLCSVIGFSLLFLELGMQGVGVITALISRYLASHAVMGPGAELYRMLHSGWFSTAGAGLLAYALMLPLTERALRSVPEVHIEPRRVRMGKLFSLAVLAMGGGYIFNFAGTALNGLLSLMTGRPSYNMTPVNELMQGMNWVTAVYVGIIAPVIEEYIFRGLILNRLRPLGDKAAIVFSAVMFGLMHGNLSQFLYATAIGIVFGYLAVKTGRIFYSSILHIAVNSYTTFVVMGVLNIAAGNLLAAAFGTMLIGIVTLGTIIAAIIIFAVNSGKVKLKRGNWPEGVEYRDFSSAMFFNPGAAAFGLLCIFMMLLYAFFL